MIYQDTNLKICLSLFGWKEKILPNLHVHIVHCTLFLPMVFSEFFALRLLRVDRPEADYAEDIRTAVLTASSIDQRYNRYNIHPYLYFA